VSKSGLRGIFDEDAELYDRARPGYPAGLLSDLATLAGIGPGSRAVEIGPATGQATLDLLARGAHVVAVELGPELAAVLRRKVAGTTAEVVISTFEDWLPPKEPFDVVTAFTAWHWLDPAVRTDKAASVLRPGGALATVTTTHVLGGTERFFIEVQECYERWDPDTPAGLRLPPAEAVPPATDEADESALFSPAVRRRYEQDVPSTTAGLRDVLNTYSRRTAPWSPSCAEDSWSA
jgi:SAM-dependent methyltransferase